MTMSVAVGQVHERCGALDAALRALVGDHTSCTLERTADLAAVLAELGDDLSVPVVHVVDNRGLLGRVNEHLGRASSVAAGHVGEQGAVVQEHQPAHTGGAGAVLGDDDLGGVLVSGLSAL